MSFFTLVSSPLAADRRDRRCCVYENIGPGYHLLLVDDDGGLILVEQVSDFEIAIWLASLVNQALGELGALLP
jgi:hypothetical protein